MYSRYRYHYEILNLPMKLPWALSLNYILLAELHFVRVLTLYSVQMSCYNITE